MTNLARRPGRAAVLGDHERRLRAIERQPPGRWVYVGEAPDGTNAGDEDCTPDSPPFENGVTNAGNGLQRLRFRRNNEWNIEVEGIVTTPVIGTADEVVVTTLPPAWRPNETQYAVGVNDLNQAVVWRLSISGELAYLGVAAAGTITEGEIEDLGFLHWGVNTDTDALGLTLNTTQTFTLNADTAVNVTTGSVFIDVQGGIYSITDTSLFDVQADTVQLVGATGGVGIDAGSAGVSVIATTVISNELAAGGTYDIRINGVLVAQIDAAGDLHLQAGASIIYDL